MENVLSRATQLLQNGAPEQALLLLNEQNSSTSECEQLKSVCKRAFSEQYLWLLNDAAKNNRKDEIKAYVNRYHNLIGHDGSIAKYEAMLTTESSSPNLNEGTRISLKTDVGELALIPAIFLLLTFLLSAFWGKITEWELLRELSYELDLKGPWIIPNFVNIILYILYIVSATIAFWKAEEQYRPSQNFNPQAIWLLVWSGLWLISCISDMVCGFNYESVAFLQGIRVCLFAGNLSLIVFLVKKFAESIKFKIPLIIAVVATGIDVVRLGVLLYVGYIQNQDSYVYKSLEGYNSIMNICYYGRVSLMLISFIMFFIMSQRTKNK